MRWGCRIAGLSLSLSVAGYALTGFADSEQDQDQVAAGKNLYNSYCITCHGPNMVNFGTRSYDLRKFPENEKERFAESVLKGKNAMPAWGHILQNDDVDALWAYVLTRGN